MNSQKKSAMDESLNTDTNNTATSAENQDKQVSSTETNESKLDEKWEGKLEVFTENEQQDIYYVKKTPFGILRNSLGYTVMCGKYQVNEGQPFQSLEEAYEDAITVSWDKIVMVVGILDRHKQELKG